MHTRTHTHTHTHTHARMHTHESHARESQTVKFVYFLLQDCKIIPEEWESISQTAVLMVRKCKKYIGNKGGTIKHRYMYNFENRQAQVHTIHYSILDRDLHIIKTYIY